jgi:transposase
MVRTLTAECANLTEAQAEIERLGLIVQKLQRSQFGRRAERLDDDQLQLGFEDRNADTPRVEATLPIATVKTPRSRPDHQACRRTCPASRLDLEHQARKVLYRCGGPNHTLSHGLSHVLPIGLTDTWWFTQ